MSAVEARLTNEDRAWAQRICAFMEALERFDHWTVRHHVHHLAACLHAGIEPAAPWPFEWTDAAIASWRREVELSTEILRDYDAEAKLAVERGVGVTVEFAADPRVPRARADAVEGATRAGVVELTVYRERRPPRRGGAA
jgi:hypothetical protein